MFLIAHLALIPAFRVKGISRKRLFVSLGLVLAITAGITVYLARQIPPNERPFVYAYSVVLALMLGFAGGTFGAGSRGLVPLAALLFYVSDFFLAQTAFLDGGQIWTLTGYPMYYTACTLFAWTILEAPAMRMKLLTT